MIRFVGYRPQPPQEYVEKGLTNQGSKPDYEGVVTPQGRVVLEWQTAYKSVTIYDSFKDFWHITGHPEYGTKLVWLDDPSVAVVRVIQEVIDDASKP